ncbi:unnamed protein product [Camellia sinensis]
MTRRRNEGEERSRGRRKVREKKESNGRPSVSSHHLDLDLGFGRFHSLAAAISQSPHLFLRSLSSDEVAPRVQNKAGVDQETVACDSEVHYASIMLMRL